MVEEYRWCRWYTNLIEEALKAIKAYKEDIEKGAFPSEDQSFK